jgi:mRNA interferase RelE/StbE
MFNIVFKGSAARALDKLPPSIRVRILKKLAFYSKQRNPLHFAERLKDPSVGSWRFRIGDYRVIFDTENNKIVILKIGHRKEIYR